MKNEVSTTIWGPEQIRKLVIHILLFLACRNDRATASFPALRKHCLSQCFISFLRYFIVKVFFVCLAARSRMAWTARVHPFSFLGFNRYLTGETHQTQPISSPFLEISRSSMRPISLAVTLEKTCL